MEKTLTIDGKEIKLKSHGAIPLLYKQQFGRDFFSEITKMGVNQQEFDLTKLDTEVFYNLTWLFAKTADKEIPSSPVEWLMTFDEFPLMEVLPDVIEMLMRLLQRKKK